MFHESAPNISLSADGDAVVILDQSLLPNETKYIELRDSERLFEALAMLRVRGAPAIGVFAAFALYVIMRRTTAEDHASFYAQLIKQSSFLDSARPTAVNLTKQLRRIENLVNSLSEQPIPLILEAMREEAESIRREDAEMCRAISEHGLSLICGDSGILTYCNAGSLATSGYGTGLGPIFLAKERGINLRVYCCETRPLLQGARLTAYELSRAGIDCTLICDNMVSTVMKDGLIDAVFVGCDRAARNGDAANKIGTSGLAILAKHYGVPFYVFCPSSSIDLSRETGADIEIEQRPSEEITELFFEKPIAPAGIKCLNPAFDVTDNALITAIITERGICKAPYAQSL